LSLSGTYKVPPKIWAGMYIVSVFAEAIDELNGDLLVLRESRTEKSYYQNTFPEVFS